MFLDLDTRLSLAHMYKCIHGEISCSFFLGHQAAVIAPRSIPLTSLCGCPNTYSTLIWQGLSLSLLQKFCDFFRSIMTDAQYRRELELELERLTKELADVRVEKAQQRQRIEQLQLEQTQLKDQLSHRTTGDKEMRSDLAQQLHTLHQVVRHKKQEHSKVKQEWERSQEQYNQLKQTVDVLQGKAIHNGESKQSEPGGSDFVRSVMGSTVFESLADEVHGSAAKQIEDFTWEDQTMELNDNGTVTTELTEYTKDSLQVHRRSRGATRRSPRNASVPTNEESTDNDTVITELTKDSLSLPRHKNLRKDKEAGSSKEADARAAFDDSFAVLDNHDNGDAGTVVTAATKDSLSVHRQKNHARSSKKSGESGLTKFLDKHADDTEDPPSAGNEKKKSLGAFFDKESRRRPNDGDNTKDLKSANE